MKEWFRKRLVILKRHPNHIPLIMIVICLLVFNLSLTNFSNTIAMINEPGMGICFFVIVLCSFLSFITYLSAFPNRKEPKKGSIILTYAMLGISIICNGAFYYFILKGIKLKSNPIEVTSDRLYIYDAQNMCIIHSVLLIITIVIMALLPIYKKALQKINTNIEIKETEIKEIEGLEEV